MKKLLQALLHAVHMPAPTHKQIYKPEHPQVLDELMNIYYEFLFFLRTIFKCLWI